MSECKFCGLEMLGAVGCTICTIKFPDGEILPSVAYKGKKLCHDCWVEPGSYHHPGCDMEKCPKCGGQLISCGCLEGNDV